MLKTATVLSSMRNMSEAFGADLSSILFQDDDALAHPAKLCKVFMVYQQLMYLNLLFMSDCFTAESLITLEVYQCCIAIYQYR